MIKQTLRKAYHVLPPSMRLKIARVGPLASLQRRWFQADTSMHDAYYTDQYYEEDVVEPASKAAPFIRDAIVNQFQPDSVIDIGCGSGEYLLAFKEAGIDGHGIELAAAALQRCHQKGLDVIRADLTSMDALPWQADVVYSFEVAEHIDEAAAANFVGLLTTAARKAIVLTAAGPGQAGLCHVNCQPKSYWVKRFQERGFRYDEPLTERWQAANKDRGLAPWFEDNLMIFHKE